MGVIHTKAKAGALRAVERDRHLISDQTARDRVIDTEPAKDRDALRRVHDSKEYQDMRMKVGK